MPKFSAEGPVLTNSDPSTKRQAKLENYVLVILFILAFFAMNTIDPAFSISEQLLNPTYSSYQVQMDALLHGRLSVGHSLQNMQHDWAWHDGAQITWGLGIPILTMPFHLLAKLFGLRCFPERVAWFIIFVLLFLATVKLARRLQFETSLAKGVGVLSAFFIPVFWLTTVRNESYEQAVYFLSYFSFLAILASLYYFTLERPSTTLWASVFLSAGALCIIRPTGLMSGAAIIGTLGCLEFFYKPLKRILFIKGVFLFAIGILFQISINKIRFGSWLEFGHNLTVAGNSIVDYLNKIEDPFKTEPFWSAAKELFGALFFNPDYNWGLSYFEQHLFLGQSLTTRFREMYSPTFGFLSLGVLIGAWALIFKRNENSKLYRFLGVYSFFQILFCAVLYLRAPMGSRYMADFSPGFFAAYLSVFLYLAKELLPTHVFGRRDHLRFFLSFVPLLVLLFPWPPRKGPELPTQFFMWNESLQITYAPNSPWKEPPKTYTCVEKPIPETKRFVSREERWLDKIRYNGEGWDHLFTCEVKPFATLYSRVSKCLSLKIRTTEEKLRSDPEFPIVKVGLKKLKQKSKTQNLDFISYEYCLEDGDPEIEKVSPIFLGFVRAQDLSRYGKIALLEVKF